MAAPLIAIVGAPNVGKSTLFNRLVGSRRSIVTDEPGVTRDRIYAAVRDVPTPFRLVDTGGLTDDAVPLVEEIARQAERAIAEAAVLLFVTDARAGPTAADRELAERLRRRGLPVVLVANKVDSSKAEREVDALYELGMGAPVPVSAEHGLGIDLLLERIEESIGGHGDTAENAGADELPRALHVAIVGRPNVGKSSLLNRLAGEERTLVDEMPGTTRDAVDTLLQIGERRYRLIDTAGIRRRGKVRRGAERFSVARARRNIDACDVAILVLDATEPFAAQDAHIAGYVRDAHKPLVIAVNKWDLVQACEAEAKRREAEARERLGFVKEAPLLLISAKTGQRVAKLLERADELHAAGGIRVPTPEINRWLRETAGPALQARPGRGALRLYYATQKGVHPPTFVLFCNEPALAHFSFRRHLENSLRARFGFGGTPLRLQFRGRRPPAGER